MQSNKQSIEVLEIETLQKINIPYGYIKEIMLLENKDVIITLLMSTYAKGYEDCKKDYLIK